MTCSPNSGPGDMLEFGWRRSSGVRIQRNHLVRSWNLLSSDRTLDKSNYSHDEKAYDRYDTPNFACMACHSDHSASTRKEQHDIGYNDPLILTKIDL